MNDFARDDIWILPIVLPRFKQTIDHRLASPDLESKTLPVEKYSVFNFTPRCGFRYAVGLLAMVGAGNTSD